MAFETTRGIIANTRGIPDLVGIVAGATKGYFDSRGVDLGTKTNYGLVYGPIVAKAGIGALLKLVVHLTDGDTHDMPKFIPISSGAISQGIVGALEVGLGYCIGYTIGSLTR